MLALFSRSAKARKQTSDWFRMAEKIHDFRRDLLSAEVREKLANLMAELKALSKDRSASIETHQAAAERADTLLRSCGGSFYPRAIVPEYIEMFLVVAILAIGFRSFFLQPFEIPTNSMYPTYNGLTSTLVDESQGAPNPAIRVVQQVVTGTSRFVSTAPIDGELFLPVGIINPMPDSSLPGKLPTLHFRLFDRGVARPYLPVMRGMNDTYFQFVGNEAVELKLPADFDYDRLIRQWLVSHTKNPRLTTIPYKGKNLYAIGTGIHFKAGQPMVAFEIHKGDMLFVDRFSYHWIAPKVGDPFVFRTDHIERMSEAERHKYYIKRLVGQGGDTLEIQPPVLLRNGAPITGADAFAKNAAQDGEYEGYIRFPHVPFSGETPIKVPADHFFAMGDNSDQSSDSRVWGFVPKTDVIGRAIFIFYPFTSPWGPAQ